MFKKFIFLFIMAEILSGCFSAMHYPEKWPKLADVPNSQCASISGRYRLISDSHPEYHGICSEAWSQGYCRSLDQILLNSQPIAGAKWADIHQEDDRIEVVVGEGENVLLKREMKKDESYVCDPRGVAIKSESYLEDADIGMGVHSYKYVFRRADDGSLVMQEIERGVLVIWIPPLVIPGGVTQWWRWQPITDTP